MKHLLILIALIFLISNVIGQAPKGSYFENIEGTVWKSGEVNRTMLEDEKAFFELSLIRSSIVETKATTWTFGKNLVIESYNEQTQKSEITIDCEYTINVENHTLIIVLDNHQLQFTYTPISTGNFVTLSKKAN